MNKFISSIAAIALVVTSMVIAPVRAAGVAVTDTLSVTTASTVSNHTITFTATSGIPASGTIKVTFPAGFAIGSVNDTDIDLTDDAVDVVIAATPSGTTWGAAFSGQVLTLTNGSSVVAGGSVVVIEIGLNATADVAGDAQITNPAAGNYGIVLTTSAGDLGGVVVPVGNANQVSVSATVDPILSFSLSPNALALGTLPTAANTYANDAGTSLITPTVNSNAEGGIVITMVSTGLKSGTKEIGITDIAGGVAPTTGTDYYKVSTNATPNLLDANGVDMTTAAGTDMLASQTVKSFATPVAAGTVAVTVGARADVTTEAGSYTDTLTFIATPTF